MSVTKPSTTQSSDVTKPDFVGGGAPIAAQALTPIDASAPESDPNSILTSATYSGGYLEATLQSPGAYSAPTQGVIWDCGPAKDLWGDAASLDAEDIVRPGGLTDQVNPADTYVGVVIADGPPTSFTVALGIMLRSNGTGYEPAIAIFPIAAAWQITAAGAYDATARRVRGDWSVWTSDNSARSFTAWAQTTAGAYLRAANSLATLLGTVTGLDRVWLTAGWVAGSGSAPATVRISGALTAIPNARLVADLGG